MSEVKNSTDIVDAAREAATGKLGGREPVYSDQPISPSRIVLYRMGLPRDGKEAETSQMRVAICVNVTSAGASLKVLSPYDSGSVFRPGVQEGNEIGQWSWPPRS